MSGSALIARNDKRLRICAIVDGRSPIPRAWLTHFARAGHEIHLISTFPCDSAGPDLASVNVVPVALANFAGGGARAAAKPASRVAALRRRVVGRLMPAAYGWVAPFDVGRHVGRTRALIQSIDPDVVHAMRIQYEGVLAAAALDGLPHPLTLSVWGNDLEFWASRYRLIGRMARRALTRADALIPDCERDLRLAADWGWSALKPAAVLPGNGGVDATLFHQGTADRATLSRLGIPSSAPIVLNARGFRSYVRNDTFFRSIPHVLEQHRDALFVGVGMKDDPRAERWVRELGIEHSTRLLPTVSRAEMAALFRAADVAVSPSLFDGTPNTLLEAMACGAFPVAGDIASVREWIDDGINGLLCDPADEDALAAAVNRALSDDALRRRAATKNHAIILERAEFEGVMHRAEALYRQTIAMTELG